MIIETYTNGVLVETRETPDPEPREVAPTDEIAQALAALPPDTLAALRAALGL